MRWTDLKIYKRLAFISLMLLLFLAGCSSKEELALDSKHEPLPDYVLNSSEIVKETYIMAAQYPQALSSAPCYCGCFASDGHESVLDCFVGGLGPNQEVTGWDTMGLA